MSGKVLVIGSGGREHAITWKLSQSPQVGHIYVAPGSYAIQQISNVTCVDININKYDEVAEWCKSNNITLVVVGPEDPLAKGIADVLTAHNIPIFGPQKDAAQIEADKAWAKSFMDRYNIPTARWKAFTDAQEAKSFIECADFLALVVKASGLAAGKGVVVAESKEEACRAVDSILTDRKFGAAGEHVVVEELLVGEEVSVLAFCDGSTVRAMLPSQDHKRIFAGDLGANTGGMGAYCPCPLLDNEALKYIEEHILQATVAGFVKEDIKFIGCLYAGLMLTENGPKVLEFNCRFGDPETEVILPLLKTDLYQIMTACCSDSLESVNLEWHENLYAAGVVLASKGYPESSSKGQVISGLKEASQLGDSIIFHCGTALKDSNIVTNGGRVLISVSLAPQLMLAAAHATNMCEMIQYDGKQYRKDIALKGIPKSILLSGKLTYAQSGVDIVKGEKLVDYIKPLAKATPQRGVVGGIGGFGGLFDLKKAGFQDPLLVSGTDGVGTKLKIAQEVGIHDTIGIDLVAMCVNDILAHGAEPLFFLDYFACGKLDMEISKQVLSGIAKGCTLADCNLIGGETAEMPDMYPPGDYDLAGFSVGAVERNYLLPKINEIEKGDVVIGLPSSGIHSNGFSLVRNVIKMSGMSYTEVAPFSDGGKSLGEELLTPTEIYVSSLKDLLKKSYVKAFAHITGGGLLQNIPRILPATLRVELNSLCWQIPKVFGWLAVMGGINEFEMLRTFNCGIGGVLIVNKEDEHEVLSSFTKIKAVKIGYVKERKLNESAINVDNFDKSMDTSMRLFATNLPRGMLLKRKRVAVLISGSGSNLQALIDATRDSSRCIGADVMLVISNKGSAYGVKRAENAGIPHIVINHNDYATRGEFDTAMHAELMKARIDIVCLAGFMRILSEEFTRKWAGKLLNVHPSLLPLFKGARAWKQALDAEVRVTGCSVHFVDEEIDNGAIIVQKTVPVMWDDTEETLLNRIHTVEHEAYPEALKLVATEKVQLGQDNKLIWK